MSATEVTLTPALSGLTEAEVIARWAAGQGNNARLSTGRSYWQILQENLITFVNAVFFSLSLMFVVLGSPSDAFLIGVVILGGVVISVIQEVQAKRKLDQIALLTRPKATVIRNGSEQDIDPAQIVVGDLLVLRPGDQVVVDGTVMEAKRLEIDESLLTGESDRIPKQFEDWVYSGSFCVSGSGYYEARRVGAESLAHQLTMGARAYRQMLTPLQTEINLVIRVFLLLACFFWILVLLSIQLGNLSLDMSVQMAAVIAGLVPSGLYLAIILAYTLGAVRILGQNVLIQQANAVESLSNVDVMCLDKTGTLTANRIGLQSIQPLGGSAEQVHLWLSRFVASLSTQNSTSEAIAAVCPGSRQPTVAEVPFSSAYKWSGVAFDLSDQRGSYVLGAPEVLGSWAEEITTHIQARAEQGLRVLLFAYSPLLGLLNEEGSPRLPEELLPLAVLTFYDELRSDARATLDNFLKAGIRLKIISGDNPQTVAALAKQAGLSASLESVSGLDLAHMDEAEFARVAESSTVFGRITPEQKARLVQALRQQGHYVAMVGDGVNDVLALKQANLGIAMEGGSPAARGVADIVLLKNSFAALPHAFLEGQRIRNGIQDVLKLFMVRVFVVTLLIPAAAMVTGTFPLLNKYSAIITLIGVGLPTICIPAWAKPGSVPRRSVFLMLLHFVLPATLTMTLVGVAVYTGYMVSLLDPLLRANPGSDINAIIELILPYARSALVTFLVFCQLLLVLFLKPPSRAWVGGEPLSGDWRYVGVVIALFGLYLGIVLIDPFRHFFELALLGPRDYLLLGLIALLWAIGLRHIWRCRILDRFLGVRLGG